MCITCYSDIGNALLSKTVCPALISVNMYHSLDVRVNTFRPTLFEKIYIEFVQRMKSSFTNPVHRFMLGGFALLKQLNVLLESLMLFEVWTLGGVHSVARLIYVNEQSQSNRECSFQSSCACSASGRSYPRIYLCLH